MSRIVSLDARRSGRRKGRGRGRRRSSRVHTPHPPSSGAESHSSTPPLNGAPPGDLYIAHSLAPATRRSYESGWRIFEAWCRETRAVRLGASCLRATAEHVAEFAADLATRGQRPSTIEARIAAIRFRFERAQLPSPTLAPIVRDTLRGIRRRHGTAPRRKDALTVCQLAQMVAFCDDSPRGLRDRALLLLGFAGALRRSELVALEVGDLDPSDPRGLLVTVRRQKNDPEGRGHIRAVLRANSEGLCPVRAVARYLEAVGVTEGPVFRRISGQGRVLGGLDGRSVSRLVRELARRCGFDADLSGHSLRIGFVTAARERGASLESIADHTGHQSLRQVSVYTRRIDAFTRHAGEGVL